MNNVEKKLDALIEALGFEVEAVKAHKELYIASDIDEYGKPKANAKPKTVLECTDYKLTKKLECGEDRLKRRTNLLMSLCAEFQSGAITAEEFSNRIMDIS